MPDPVLTSRSCVVFLGGAEISTARVTEALTYCDHVVAIDGGAGAALANGVVPDCVIGDLDSLDRASQAEIPADRLVHVEEQESTDFEKGLTRVDAPLILALGFSGGRLDHSLEVLSVIARHPDRAVIVVGEVDIALHCPPEIALDLPVGSRVSLFPLTRVQARSQGLEWPLAGLVLDPLGKTGTSNRVTGPVRLSTDGPGAILILPLAGLGAAVQALGG